MIFKRRMELDMERLTRKSSSTDMVWFVDHNNNDMDLEPCEMSYTHNKLAIQKLAAYEDLGFTPEDIAYMAKFFKENTSAEAIADNMRIAAKLIEWEKWKTLEEEGRLVVLNDESFHH
jgi:hypothetical protein